MGAYSIIQEHVVYLSSMRGEADASVASRVTKITFLRNGDNTTMGPDVRFVTIKDTVAYFQQLLP